MVPAKAALISADVPDSDPVVTFRVIAPVVALFIAISCPNVA